MATALATRGQGGRLCSLPPESIIMIANHATVLTHDNLSRTCRYLLCILQPDLFLRDLFDGSSSPMAYACTWRNKNIIFSRALRYGSPSTVDHLFNTGYTPLCLASRKGSGTAVSCLIKLGADVNKRSADNMPPLWHALSGLKAAPHVWRAGMPYVEAILRLVAAGADVRLSWTESALEVVMQAHDHGNILRSAADSLIRKLVQKGVDPNDTPTLMPPVRWALRTYDDRSLATYLLNNGADPDQGENEHFPSTTALGFAILFKDVDLVEYLLLQGASVNPLFGHWVSPLHFAVHYGNARKVQMLLKHGANPNLVASGRLSHTLGVRKRFHLTTLSLAIWLRGTQPHHEENQLENIKLLLLFGADPNLRDTENWTALGLALSEPKIAHRASIVETLLKHGACPNLADHKGRKPLLLAVMWWWYFETTPDIDRYRIVDMLLKAGADPSKGSDVDDNLTPLRAALKVTLWLCHVPLELQQLELLYERQVAYIVSSVLDGCDPVDNEVNNKKRLDISPGLIHCNYRWNNKLIPILLRAGARVSYKDLKNMRSDFQDKKSENEKWEMVRAKEAEERAKEAEERANEKWKEARYRSILGSGPKVSLKRKAEVQEGGDRKRVGSRMLCWCYICILHDNLVARAREVVDEEESDDED